MLKTYFINGYWAGECDDWASVAEIRITVYTSWAILPEMTADKPMPVRSEPYKTVAYTNIFRGKNVQFMLDKDSLVSDQQVWKVLQDYERDPDKCRIMIVAMWQFIVDAKRCS